MSDKDYLTKTLTDTALSRRSFLKWSAAMGGTVALAGGVKFGLKAVEAATDAAEPEGKWVVAPCWHDCGARNVNKVYVVDGVVKKQKTDDTIPDSLDCMQARACARGWAIRQQIFGADRLKYPMKRKNWEPGGGKKELRGRDEWVRISWDEALDTVASEIKRITQTYGNESIFSGATMGSDVDRVLYLNGGCVEAWGSLSLGTWNDTGPRIGALTYGLTNNLELSYNDRLDLLNSDIIVIWGANPAWSQPTKPNHNFMRAKKAGAKIIIVDPIYTDSVQTLADEWIPVRPTTDHALILGMAYTLITEDNPETNPLIDWDFLNRCTVGFDKDHLPSGVNPQDNFKDYVLGTYDGQPKTPEWAAEICGIPPEKIRWFAREIGCTKKVALLYSCAPTRVIGADAVPQAMMTLAWMTGQIGQPGRMAGTSYHAKGSDGGPALVGEDFTFHTGVPGLANPLRAPAFSWPEWSLATRPPSGTVINRNEIWDAIINGKYTQAPGKIRDINIQLIYHGASNSLNQFAGAIKGIAAHRKVECVISQCYALNTNSKYADIVLPITTQWERYGGVGQYGHRDEIVVYSQVIDPLFEAKDETWIASELAKRLGLDPIEAAPVSYKQQFFNQVAWTPVAKEDGTGYEKLVSISEEDIKELDFVGTPQQGRIPLKQLIADGVYHVTRTPGDKLGYIAYEEFRKDPQAHPLPTTSGKFEIYCQALADCVKSFTGDVISPLPKYRKAMGGYEDTYADWENKIKGDYPLQYISTHGIKRGHSALDNVRWLQKAFPNVLWVNPLDAQAGGIKQGDTVLIKSAYGKMLLRAYVTDSIRPGVTMSCEGAWLDFDDELGVDVGGCPNSVIGGRPGIGQDVEGFNSSNVEIEKWTGKPLAPDYQRPQRVIFGEEA